MFINNKFGVTVKVFEALFKKNLEKNSKGFEDKLCNVENKLRIIGYNPNDIPESIKQKIGENNER